MIAAGADPMALAAASPRPPTPSCEAIGKLATPINEKNKKEIEAGRHDRRQQRSRRSATSWPTPS